MDLSSDKLDLICGRFKTADGEVLVIIGGLTGSVDSATTEVIDFGGGSCDGASLPDLTFDTYSSLAMTDGDGFPQTCGGYSELVYDFRNFFHSAICHIDSTYSFSQKKHVV